MLYFSNDFIYGIIRQIELTIDVEKGTHCFVTENKMESEIIFGESELEIEDLKVENNKFLIKCKLKSKEN